LRFFYQHTLGRKWMIDFIPYPRRVKKLPLVPSQAEVRALLQVTTNLKHHTILATIYATGLRVSEAANLLVSDIDSGRQLITVRQGKGQKDRFVILSPRLLELTASPILEGTQTRSISLSRLYSRPSDLLHRHPRFLSQGGHRCWDLQTAHATFPSPCLCNSSARGRNRPPDYSTLARAQ
jgi:hypothetical protein